jgi:uncharacterized membrane protein (Fun14 family)
MTSLWQRACAQTATGPDAVSKTFLPLLSQVGFGAAVGFVMGFTLKKIGKLAAFMLGCLFIFLQVLSYYGIITIQWEPIRAWWAQFVAPEALQGRWEIVRAILFSNLPACGGAIPGFVLGFKMG